MEAILNNPTSRATMTHSIIGNATAFGAVDSLFESECVNQKSNKGKILNKDEEIEHLKSQIDFLSRNYVTGLEGRHRFMQRLRRRFATGDKFYLVMHDVDGLHEVNRVHGYAAGDSLLREVANDLKMCQEPCCAYHIGGDEFYVLYSDEPRNIICQNTTSAEVASDEHESVDSMLDSVDKLVSEKKLKTKKRRRDDI